MAEPKPVFSPGNPPDSETSISALGQILGNSPLPQDTHKD